MVGKILNHEVKEFRRGDEKGFFEYGGSTIIVLVKKDVLKISNEILEASQQGIETPVKMGQVIGNKK